MTRPAPPPCRTTSSSAPSMQDKFAIARAQSNFTPSLAARASAIITGTELCDSTCLPCTVPQQNVRVGAGTPFERTMSGDPAVKLQIAIETACFAPSTAASARMAGKTPSSCIATSVRCCTHMEELHAALALTTNRPCTVGTSVMLAITSATHTFVASSRRRRSCSDGIATGIMTCTAPAAII